MARLEEITVGSTVKGIIGDEPVTIVAVQWYGTNVLEITYKNDRMESAVSGNVFNEVDLCICRLDKLARNNCLKRAGINTLSEFVSRMETDFASLIAVRNLGKKSLEEVLVKLKKRGLPCDAHLKRYMQTLSADDAKSWEGVYEVVESTQPENVEYEDLDLDEIDFELDFEIDETINAERVGDFDSLDCCEELHTLGLQSAKDFPENATASEIGKLIDDWYRSCKLSGEADLILLQFWENGVLTWVPQNHLIDNRLLQCRAEDGECLPHSC